MDLAQTQSSTEIDLNSVPTSFGTGFNLDTILSSVSIFFQLDLVSERPRIGFNLGPGPLSLVTMFSLDPNNIFPLKNLKNFKPSQVIQQMMRAIDKFLV